MNKSAAVGSRSPIGQVIPKSHPVLPGESEEDFLNGLAATIEELQATTPLQIYIAEKIFDCLWWIRRYETQKLARLTHCMVESLTGVANAREVSDLYVALHAALSKNEWSAPVVVSALKARKLTPERALLSGMGASRVVIGSLDEMISLKLKTLTTFQGAYENLVNRKIFRERIQLQNDLVRRDLQAIDVDSAEVKTPNAKAIAHVKSKKAPGK